MKNGILIENYSKLSKVFLNRFTLFVDSPYFNKHIPTKKLHNYLMELHPNFEESACTKELIFKKVFGIEKFKLQKLKDISSSLLDLFESFLANEALKKDKTSFRRLEIQECVDNKLNKFTKKVLNVSFKEKNKSTINQSKLYYHNYLLNDFAYTFELQSGERKISANHLQESINSLDKFYFTEKMIIGSVILNRKIVLESDINFLFYDEIDKLISKNQSFFNTENAIQINHQLFLLQKTNNEEYYYTLKNLVLNCSFNQSEIKLYFSFLSNFCIRMVNSGKQEFLMELFNLNKEIIKRDALLDNDVISEWSYKNIIGISLRLKEFDWVENFIETYSKNLSKKNYLNAYNYNKSHLAYYKKEYGIALEYLIDVEFTDVFYVLSSKALLLKIYFETNEFMAIDSLLHSFRLLTMRQKKISKKLTKSYLNLIKFTKSLLILKQKKDFYTKEELNRLREELTIKINNANPIANKTWLLEKV